MAATKYQVLYRYINEATNTPITNSMDSKYEPVCEFYTDPHHKIFFDDDPISQAEAANEQQELISFGNSSENPKNNMLFAYDGTKKIRHPQWVPEQVAYVVRDWKKLKRSSIGNQGDFTKDFTTINALTPEDGGTVICTENVFKKYFKDITVIQEGSYTSQQIITKLTEATMFSLNPELSWEEFMSPSNWKTTYYRDSPTTYMYYTGPILVDGITLGTITGYDRFGTKGYPLVGNVSDFHLYSKATIKASQIETTTMPGHYEEAIDAPYLIKDMYKRIQLSPWFVNCTCASLESAISKARALVDMVGIENVKLIKVVPFDQFVKIK